MPKKSLAMRTLSHLLNEDFRRHNLVFMDYTPDMVEHVVRFHYNSFLSMRASGDLDAIVVLADIGRAFKQLSEEQQNVVRDLILGFSTTAISSKYKVPAGKVAKQAFRVMSAYLLGKTLTEDENIS